MKTFLLAKNKKSEFRTCTFTATGSCDSLLGCCVTSGTYSIYYMQHGFLENIFSFRTVPTLLESYFLIKFSLWVSGLNSSVNF